VIENITKISSKTNYACRLNDTRSLAIAKKADRTVYDGRYNYRTEPPTVQIISTLLWLHFNAYFTKVSFLFTALYARLCMPETRAIKMCHVLYVLYHSTPCICLIAYVAFL